MSDTNSGRKCSRCGAALPADAPEGLCPRCLMGLNFTAPTEEVGPKGTIIINSPPVGGEPLLHLPPDDPAVAASRADVIRCPGGF